jgi:hypothetical protein
MNPMNHEIQLIDRYNWRYWLDGNGVWQNRWDCAGHDVFLLIFMAAGVTWMVSEYFWYAYLVKNANSLFADPSYRKHLDRLMKVFLFCGSIHLFNIVLWFWTPHIIWCLSYYVNAFVTHSLNRWFRRSILSKSLSDSIAESRLHELERAISSVAEAEELPPKTLREWAEELRKMV